MTCFDNDTFYSDVSSSILNLLNKYENELNEETVSAVRHFVEHDEYEMAYEGLFIDLMAINFNPKDIDTSVYMKIGENLNLDKQTIFDANFWNNLVGYINKQ